MKPAVYRHRLCYPPIVRTNDERLSYLVAVDRAISIGEDYRATWLNKGKVQALVVAFGAGEAEPVASDVVLVSLFCQGKLVRGNLTAPNPKCEFRVIVSYGVAVDAQLGDRKVKRRLVRNDRSRSLVFSVSGLLFGYWFRGLLNGGSDNPLQ